MWMVWLVALVVPVLHASDELAVTYRAGAIQPGDVVRVAVRAPAGASGVTATWHGRAVPFTRDADGVWRALIGIDVEAPIGPASLVVTAARPGAAPLTATEAIAIAPKAVRTRRIRVNPKFVNPPKSALPRIQRESALQNELFARPPTPRLWTNDAVRPVKA